MNLTKYLNESKKWTGKEKSVAQEIKIWSDSLKWASEQVIDAEFDNALKSLESVKKMSGKLITMVRNLKKESSSSPNKTKKKAAIKKRTQTYNQIVGQM